MVWLPTAKPEVLKLAAAVPPVVLSVPWPILVAPSANVTTPVGVPEPPPVTVAVKVTDCPNTDGLTDDTTTVLLVLVAGLTV